jgi:hypothetical protein
MKQNFKKITTSTLILGFLLIPVLNIFAETTNNYTPTNGAYNPSDPWGSSGGLNTYNQVNNPYKQDTNQINSPFLNAYDVNNLDKNAVDRQIAASIKTTVASTSTAKTGVVSNTASQLGGCGAAQILSNMLASSVQKAIGQTTQKVVKDVVTETVSAVTNVPVAEGGIVANNIQTLLTNTERQTAATVGAPAADGGIIGALGLASPSWDAVAYCIVNAMIIYISDSTIEWINTGFNGNPAFLENPDMFFKQLAEEEQAAFIQNLAYGVTGGTNVCDVFRAAMVKAALSRYGQQSGYGYGYDTGGYGRGINNGFLGCAFDQNPGQLNSFVQGNFIQGGGWDSWYNVTQTQQNNPYEAYFRTNDQLSNRVVSTQASQTRDLGWNNGFLNYKKCDPKTKKCDTVTPGNVIQGQLESTLNLPKNRLVLATKFDQVISAFVEQMIASALGKALEGVGQ